MGFLARVSSVASPARLRASSVDNAFDDRYYMPSLWSSTLSAAGVDVTPDLALTLSAYYCGVTTIAYDLATLPAQVFKHRDDGGKDRVRGGSFAAGSGGIGGLVYLLRWQPNAIQTATEFFVSMVAQFLLRNRCYAEIVSGPSGFLEQLLPRHPDRVRPERLPSGRLRYKLTESDGTPRYLTQDEMFVVRDLSLGGLDSLSRVQYGANAIGAALAAEAAAGKFFKSGMTASTVATYTGEMSDEDEDALHKSITRYATGVDSSFGLMLIPDDVKISNLSIEPEKAQMMLAREWGAREVARQLRIPGYKLGIQGSQTYASQVQSAVDYVVGCLRPIGVTFEQAVQRDLILAKDTYFMEFLLEALLRGDPDARAAYYERAIRNRWMRPSEVRLRENLNPDEELDRLSAGDFRPGQSGASAPAPPSPGQAGARSDRGSYLAFLAVHDNSVRCLRRERAALEKLAKKHAADPDGWKAGLRDFYGDHAGFVSQTMHLNPAIARGYAAQHGSEFEAKGMVLLEGQAGVDWERFEADELAALSLSEGDTVDDWFNRRLADVRTPPANHITVPVTIAAGAVQSHTTVEAARVEVKPAPVTIAKGAVQVTVAAAAPPHVEVHAGDVHIDPGAVSVTVPAPIAVERVQTIERDPKAVGLISQTRTRDVPIPKE
jgi:HK97 family phage portal protein